MKKHLITYILAALLCLFTSFEAKAVKAYPFPITVTQPDGSTLTIRIYGDEFLNWTVCGNSMVEVGKDGFYYYATFSADGGKIVSNTRARNSIALNAYSQSGHPITPPSTAIAKALATRKEMKSPSASISIGEKPFLVLLIEFADLHFTVEEPNAAFTRLLNEKGYSQNGATGSVNDYYYENSKGQFNPNFEVVGPITVSQGYKHYSYGRGYETPGARDLLIEACSLVDEKVDFTKYDLDNDGYIDNVFFYYAGHNAAEGASDKIWPHKWQITTVGNHTFDGKILDCYACSSEYRGSSGKEMCGIGTFSHEFGHVIGLPDLYDTDYEENGSSAGLGAFSLMSGGNYNNRGCSPPYMNHMEKKILGWVGEPTEINQAGKYHLETVENDKAYRTGTSNPGEFYLYENRQPNGWDEYIGAHGMLIYHIDQSNNIVNGYPASSRWKWGYGINDFAEHQCFDLVEAAYPESIAGTASTPFPGSTNNTRFAFDSSPSLRQWSGAGTGYLINNITESGQDISFDFEVDHNVYLSGTVTTASANPIDKAKVTITKLTDNSVASSKARFSAPYLRTNEIYTTQTDASGKFMYVLDQPGTYSLTFSSIGYLDFTKNYVLPNGGADVGRIALYSPYDYLNGDLKKHGNPFDSIGDGSSMATISGAVGFTAAELEPYVGSVIETITYQVNEECGSANVSVFVLVDRTEVFSQAVKNLKAGVPNTVDIKEAGITIPENSEVMIGYTIFNSPFGYPLSCDSGPEEPLGFMIKEEEDTEWSDLSAISDLNYNICVSASLHNENGLFNVLGFSTIPTEQASYSTGELFELKLTPSLKKPVSVLWYFDGVEKNSGEVIKLTAGEHTIEARLKFANGAEETLIQEIDVK